MYECVTDLEENGLLSWGKGHVQDNSFFLSCIFAFNWQREIRSERIRSDLWVSGVKYLAKLLTCLLFAQMFWQSVGQHIINVILSFQ